jgi:hypothetical protein
MGLIHRTATVDLGFEQTAALLVDDLDDAVAAATATAHDDMTAMLDGSSSLPEGAVVPTGLAVGDDVTVDASEARATWNQAVSFDLRWHTSSRDTLFASLSGTVEVAAVTADPPRTGLTFIGSWTPTAALLGEADERSTRPLADAAVDRVLTALADHLMRSAPPAPPATAS